MELPQFVHEALIRETQKDRLIGHIARDSTAIENRERFPEVAPKSRSAKASAAQTRLALSHSEPPSAAQTSRAPANSAPVIARAAKAKSKPQIKRWQRWQAPAYPERRYATSSPA